MFSLPITSINVIKYLVPLALGFILGFYLAESVTTKIYTARITELNSKHKATTDDLSLRLTKLVEEQNTIADKLNATSIALAESNASLTSTSRTETQKALVKYKDKIVLVDKQCNLSNPGLEYIRDNITGK